jgi:nitrite reductase/ring-hydroxylating ferredoxin subunit
MRREVAIGRAELEEMKEGRFQRFMLPEPAWMPGGALATSVLVGKVGGTVRAYANVCRHHPLPLDYDAPEGAGPMALDGLHLECHQHGALYRPTDGLCTDGPCRGESLYAAGVEEHEGGVTVFLDG